LISLRFVPVALAAAAFAASVLADSIQVSAPRSRSADAATAAAPSSEPAPAVGAASMAPVAGPGIALKPRAPIGKAPSSSISMPINAVTQRPEVTGRVIVKFRDDVKARAPRTPSAVLERAGGATLGGAMNALMRGGGGVAWQAIERNPAELRQLELKAEQRSGEAAPDLAGIVYVLPTDGDLVATARAFNDLAEVEFVVIEKLPFPAMAPQAQAGAQTACGVAPRNGCQNPPGAVNCNKPGIPLNPPLSLSPTGRCTNVISGSACTNDCENPCDAGVNDVNCMLGCNDLNCCDSIGDFLPACQTDPHGWDALCAAYASSICTTTVYDTLFGIGGNDQSVPGSYKYDPCYALRTGPNPANPDFTVQASLATALPTTPLGAASFPFELVQVVNFDAIGVTSGLVTGVTATGTNPAFISSAQLANQDPSYERTIYEMTPTCFTIHAGRRGCSNTPCCVYVCLVDAFCCVVAWDADCVQVASRINSQNPCVQPLAGSIPASIAPGPADFPTISMSNFPAAGTTPNFKSVVMETSFGPQCRNLQPWIVGAPVASYLEAIDQDPGVSMVAVPAPVSQGELNSTRMFLNSGFRGGGLDIGGFENALAQLGVPIEQTRGAGVTIGIIDNSAFVNHEEFASVLSVEPNVPIVTSMAGNINPNHGTAVIGILLAQDNGFGITGVATASKGIFFPAFAGNGIGGRFLNAFATAVTSLESGDVICIPLDFPVIQADPITGNLQVLEGTVLSSPEVFLLSVLAGQLGITTVVAAGNQCTVVVSSPGAEANGPAIVAGACWPGAARFPGIFQGIHYCRSEFSNFSSAETTGEVDVAGWGAYVTTCGYGDLWRGTNGSSDPDQVNQLRTYTLQFGGTSAAAAMVAGCAARMQSSATALFGVPLGADQIKTTVRANIRSQCGFPIDSPQQLTGSVPCMGDTGGGEVNSIRGFIDFGPALATSLATQPFGSLPQNVVGFEVTVLVGTLLAGNAYTVRADDSTWLKIQAKRVGGSSPQPLIGPAIFYPPTAIISDVMVTVTTDFKSANDLTGLNCRAIGQANPTSNVFTTGYVFNAITQKWLLLPDMLLFLADEEPLPDGDVIIDSGGIGQLYNTLNLIDFSSGEGKIRFRIVTSAPPLNNNYQTWWDFLAITPNPPLDPCWVAQAVYGKATPRWMLFRTWLDRHAPDSLRSAYASFGRPVAAWLERSPSARTAMRPLLDAAISQLSRAELDGALRSFALTPEGRDLIERVRSIPPSTTVERFDEQTVSRSSALEQGRASRREQATAAR